MSESQTLLPSLLPHCRTLGCMSLLFSLPVIAPNPQSSALGHSLQRKPSLSPTTVRITTHVSAPRNHLDTFLRRYRPPPYNAAATGNILASSFTRSRWTSPSVHYILALFPPNREFRRRPGIIFSAPTSFLPLFGEPCTLEDGPDQLVVTAHPV